MTFVSHALSGVAVGVVLSEVTGVGLETTIPLSTAFSVLPDINLLWRKISDHHRDFTHYPSFWLVILVLSFALEYFLQSSSFIVSLSLIISVTTHLILDTFGIRLGVHWLAPFNYREFSFLGIDRTSRHLSEKEKALQFFRSKHVLYETVVIFSSLLLVWVF